MTGAQPNPLNEMSARAEYGNDTGFAAEAEAEPKPEYVGDMPEDPEQARTYRPGEDDQPDES